MNADEIIKESTVENLDLAKEFLKAGELSFALDQTTQAREGIISLLQFDEAAEPRPAKVPTIEI